MKITPKSLRLQIGIFGRTNVGKSSFLNMVALQDVAITSPIPGTTTDVVEKTMELLPVGPVVFLDTGGVDDASQLGSLRIRKTHAIFDRSDIILLICEPNAWGNFEDTIYHEATARKTPCIIIVNKADVEKPTLPFLSSLQKKTARIIVCSSITRQQRDEYVNALKKHILSVCPDDFVKPPPLIGDLLPSEGLAVLIVPIDLEAPKGRIILPQVQAVRDTLDAHAACLVVKESEYKQTLAKLKYSPDLVVCDSQVVDRMVAETSATVACTTFSILFARYKGDLLEMTKGAGAINCLRSGDVALIAESCSHHAVEDDIGRIKIPRWIREYTGADVSFDVCAGRDYPDHLEKYKLIIHCGSCMLTRRETLCRIHHAREAGVPITNYGVCISFLKGVLDRVLEPFPDARALYRRTAATTKKEAML